MQEFREMVALSPSISPMSTSQLNKFSREKMTAAVTASAPKVTTKTLNLVHPQQTDINEGVQPTPRLALKRFKCGLCDLRFALPRVLETHKMIEHKVPAAWKCSECGMEFLHGKSYNFHVTERHKVKPHKCSHCTLSFASKQVSKNDKHSIISLSFFYL